MFHLKFKSIFNVSASETKTYIFKCFNLAHSLAIDKKIMGFINAPIDKKIFNNKYFISLNILQKKITPITKKLC